MSCMCFNRLGHADCAVNGCLLSRNATAFVAPQAQTDTPDRVTEVLAKAWLVCDPNRGGVDPDAPDAGLGMAPGNDYVGKPRWHWFIPRAEAMRDYLSENGLVIRPK